MVSDSLGRPEPLCDNLVRLSVFMRYIATGFSNGNCMSVSSINFVVSSPVIGIAFSVIGIEVSDRRNDSVTVRGAALRSTTPHNAKITCKISGGARRIMSVLSHFIGSEGGKMKVFQILNNEVTIIQGSKVYIETLDNFKADSGVNDLPKMIVYDENQKCCVVDSIFQIYPNDTYEGLISRLDDFIAAKEQREYVPPAEPTVEDAKASLTDDYNESVDELTKSYNIALLRGDAEALASIKQDFEDLQEAYKAEMEDLK